MPTCLLYIHPPTPLPSTHPFDPSGRQLSSKAVTHALDQFAYVHVTLNLLHPKPVFMPAMHRQATLPMQHTLPHLLTPPPPPTHPPPPTNPPPPPHTHTHTHTAPLRQEAEQLNSKAVTLTAMRHLLKDHRARVGWSWEELQAARRWGVVVTTSAAVYPRSGL